MASIINIIPSGRILPLIFLVLIIVITFIIFQTSKTRPMGKIYKIPGLDAFDEAIGRAAEMGRPVSFTTGKSFLTGESAPAKLAGYSSMSYVAKKAATMGTEFYSMYQDAAELPIIDDIVRTAYTEAGKLGDYKPENLLYQPRRAMELEYISSITRLQSAAIFSIGSFSYEAVMWFEQGARIGAIQIGGTTAISQIPYMVAAFDYTMLGEEIFAAGAYLSNDKKLISDILGHDLIKYYIIAILVLSYVLVNIGFKQIVNILSM